jgi:hypothetical protein
VHRVHVAEQVSVERTPERAAEVLAKAQPEWFEAIAALAWREGELAEGRRVGAGAVRHEGQNRPRHVFEIDAPKSAPRDSMCRDFRWIVHGPSSLFQELSGQLVAFEFDGVVVLWTFARYESLYNGDDWGDGSGAERLGIACRPVEVVVRAFLGHLRTALESL